MVPIHIRPSYDCLPWKENSHWHQEEFLLQGNIAATDGNVIWTTTLKGQKTPFSYYTAVIHFHLIQKKEHILNCLLNKI